MSIIPSEEDEENTETKSPIDNVTDIKSERNDGNKNGKRMSSIWRYHIKKE